MVITSRKTILIGSYIRLQLFSFSLVCSHKRFPYNRILDIPERRQFQKKSQQLFPGCSPLWCLPAQSSPSQQEKKNPSELNKVILNQNLLQIQLTIFEMNCLFQTHRCVHHILSLGKILQCFWWAVIAVFTAADRDAFLLKVLCIVPVCVIIHPAAVQLKAKSHNKKKKRKQSYVVDSPFEKTVMRATWFKESAPVRSVLSWPLKCSYKQEPSGVYRET